MGRPQECKPRARGPGKVTLNPTVHARGGKSLIWESNHASVEVERFCRASEVSTRVQTIARCNGASNKSSSGRSICPLL